MRIISLGCPIPSPQVDNHSIANAPSLFDYDACIIDPQAVSEQIDGIASSTLNLKAPDGRQVGLGESGSFHVGLAELLQQRQRELRQLVEGGGVIVLFLYPNVRHPNAPSFAGLDRYSLIPQPAGNVFSWPSLRPADGKAIRAVAPQHAAAGYLDDLAGRLRFHAVIDVESGSDINVLGRSVGGAVVAVECRVGAGRLVCLPPTDNLAASQRKQFSESLLEVVERLVEEPEVGAEPVWSRRYDSVEAAQAREQLTAAEAELKDAQRRVREAEALLADTTRFQRILWQSQNRSFRDVVADAFHVLGYQVASRDETMGIRDGAELLLVEVASANQAVSDRLYLTLQQRIEEHYLRRNQRPKGIIVANGQRQTDPRIRRSPFPATLVNACETYGYALIPTEALYELVTYALEAPDEADLLMDIRASISETAGVLEVAADEEQEAEPTAAS